MISFLFLLSVCCVLAEQGLQPAGSFRFGDLDNHGIKDASRYHINPADYAAVFLGIHRCPKTKLCCLVSQVCCENNYGCCFTDPPGMRASPALPCGKLPRH
ncbi:unnamed protein product [Nezara viridula]|uniref:Neuropeptide n=1 Tax=Nezara viridula TaxID=85310 RepID=A0A9P0HGB8_NEZVI|nr:unnamed protein product [Nezara viridula]